MSFGLKKIYACLVCLLALSSQKVFSQLEFTENKGQWHQNVLYRSDFGSGSVFLESSGFTIALHNEDDLKRRTAYMHGVDGPENFRATNEKLAVRSFAYKVKLLGAATNVIPSPEKVQEGVTNYFIGADQQSWASNCKTFQTVLFKEIYPHIDLRYSSSGGNFKYDFIIRPGGNPNRIALRYDGPSLQIKNNELIIETAVASTKELYPYSYQPGEKGQEEIGCRFLLKNNVVTFQLKSYDLSKPVIIDPSLVFSTFSGSSAENWGYTATPGIDGSLLGGGIVFASGYPVTAGAYDVSYNGGGGEGSVGGYDIALTKYSATSGSRLFSTYLGGSGDEQPHSLICDAQGNFYLAGRTSSANFPKLRGAADNYGQRGAYDIIVVKLSANGTQLLGTAILGGSANDGVNIRPKYVQPLGAESLRRNYGDDARSEIIVGPGNTVVVASCTQSTNFPVINSNIQPGSGGLQDGVILKFNSDLSSVIFSTYFGGNKNDACFVTSINPVDGNIYVGGATASDAGIPGDKTNTIQSNFGGNAADGFVTIIRPDGSGVVKTTYLGTDGIDLVYGLKFDKVGFPYVMGTTTGNWPVINANYSNENAKQFISKLNPDLSDFVYSTVFGTNSANPNISPIAFLVDRCQNVYVSGWGGGINNNQQYNSGTTAGLPETDPLSGMAAPDGKDFYFFVLRRDATSRIFASHFGKNGGNGEHVDGGTSRFDENGYIYQALCADCSGGTNFPLTAGAYRCNTSGFNQAVVKIQMNFAGVGAELQASVDGVVNDTLLCVGGTANFRDLYQKGKRYYWDFGHSPNRYDTTIGPESSHTFTTEGVFRVMLIAEDSSTCNLRDTSYVNIKVGSLLVRPSFTWRKLLPCEGLQVEFTNTSTTSSGQIQFAPNTFVWNYGDGSPEETSSFAPPRVHQYAQPGTYLVTLTAIDTNFCNSPKTDSMFVRVNPFVKAAFNVSPTGCAPFNALFNNSSLAGTDFIWEYGDGTTSTTTAPDHTHLYANPGTYNVRLIAIDTFTCNKVDTSRYFTIVVSDKPIAKASWSPNPPTGANEPVYFTNLSLGANSYMWHFGDGETSNQIHPTHQYNETNTFNAMLIAFNEAGCPDTFRLNPRAIVQPLIDVPNAFTPGRFGENSMINVKGFGIGKLDWKIYNRIGQLVYFSNSIKNNGWDGTFKGKLQPMDVYLYTLEAIFTNGKKVRKTGDITLIR